MKNLRIAGRVKRHDLMPTTWPAWKNCFKIQYNTRIFAQRALLPTRPSLYRPSKKSCAVSASNGSPLRRSSLPDCTL